MDKKPLKFGLFAVAIIILVIGLGVLANKQSNAPGKYNQFAQCLVDKGAQFYGAFWCPHCQAQEKALGMTREALEKISLYVECSNPDKSQTQICIDKKIVSYPTWMFKDGSVLNGEQTLAALAEKTQCVLPQ